MPEEVTSAKVGIEGTEIEIGRDVVGRDKLIQNIIVVGQFLDFAKVQELIPNPSEVPNPVAIVENLERALTERLDVNLTKAIYITGELLRDLLSTWAPQQPFAAIRFRVLIPSLATHLGRKLVELNYWEAFCIKSKLKVDSTQEEIELVWLDSLQDLWGNLSRQAVLSWRYYRYGIARIVSQTVQEQRQNNAIFVIDTPEGVLNRNRVDAIVDP